MVKLVNDLTFVGGIGGSGTFFIIRVIRKTSGDFVWQNPLSVE